MNELKRLAKRLGELREALAEGNRNDTPERLLGLGRDAVFAWLQGEGPDQWIERLNVHPAQIEYLHGEGMWPWGGDLELERQLAAVGSHATSGLADGAKTEPLASIDSLPGPMPGRHRRKTLPARTQDVSASEGRTRKTSPLHLDFEQLFQVIQTVVRRVRFEFVRVVSASPDGDVRFLEVLDNPGFRTELQDALRDGLIPLGMLGWETTADTLQARSMLFPWHKDDETLGELFRGLCEDAADHVREALDEARGRPANDRVLGRTQHIDPGRTAGRPVLRRVGHP